MRGEQKKSDIDIAEGRFSAIGCLCFALAIAILAISCPVADRIENGEPIVVFEVIHSDSEKSLKK